MLVHNKCISYNRPNSVVLVDFDGVVLRNKRVLEAVKDRVDKYVGKVMRIDDLYKATKVNQYLYKQYGHSLIGLQKVIGDDAGDVVDFNKFVYEDINIGRDDFYGAKKEIVKDWEPFLNRMECLGMDVHIFSNAPKEWCLNFIDSKKVNGFVSDNLPNKSEFLKPSYEVYDVVSAWYWGKQVYFIDDKIQNLVKKHPMWTNVLFDPNIDCDLVRLDNNLWVIKSLRSCNEWML